MQRETSCNCKRIVNYSYIFLEYLISRKTLSCRIIYGRAYYSNEECIKLYTPARAGTHIVDPPRVNARLLCYTIPPLLLFDTAIASLIINIEPRSTQRTLGSHQRKHSVITY
ncbi:hypothetical protein P5V15_004776 [Pogonomyrmex californicus]